MNRLPLALTVFLVTLPAVSARADDAPPPVTTAAALPAPPAEKLDATALQERVTKSEAALDVEKSRAEVAKVKEDVATKANDAAQTQLADARSGKLVKYGITAGFAAVGMSASPADGSSGARQKSFNLSTMPYLAIMPGYWIMPELNRVYCASSYLGADQADATIATTAQAERVAKLRLSRTDREDLAGTDAAKKAAAQKKLDEVVAGLWDPTRAGQCLLGKFGLYVGKPLEYDATVVAATDGEEVTRTLQPTVSGGLAFLPNAYLTVLVGLTHTSFTEPAKDATATEPASPEATRRFVTFTVGIGGNVDLFGAMLQ